MTSTDAALINTAANSINNAANIAAQSNINRRTREWNEKMYGQQRADAMADWNLQNEYNSPTSQMARLREAGLNPNLVYGKGADNTAGVVRSSSTPAWNPEAPKFDFQSPFNDMYNFEMRQAQIDNLKVQNTVNVQEALLKAAQTEQVAQNTTTSVFDLQQKNALAPYVLEASQANVRKLNADVDFTRSQNTRADQQMLLNAAKNKQDIQESLSRMASEASRRETDKYQRSLLLSQQQSIERDKHLKDLDINLKRTGIQPGDALWLRILAQQWERVKRMIDNQNNP